MYMTALPVRYTGELQPVTVECAQFKLHSSSCTAGSSGRPDAAQMYLSCLPQALPMQIPCSSIFTMWCIVVFTMWCIVVSRSLHIVVHPCIAVPNGSNPIIHCRCLATERDKSSLQKHQTEEAPMYIHTDHYFYFECNSAFPVVWSLALCNQVIPSMLTPEIQSR